MNTVDLTLLGRTYQVACAAGQEARLRELAKMMEDKMRLAASAGQGAIGEIRLLLLAGLMLADEVAEARKAGAEEANGVRQQFFEEEDVLVAAVEHLSARINSLAARIENA